MNNSIQDLIKKADMFKKYDNNRLNEQFEYKTKLLDLPKAVSSENA